MSQVLPVTAELVAVIVAVTAGEPRVLTIDRARALPSGPFQVADRSLQASLRSWVEQQTRHPLGYVEQLYTFADSGRVAGGDVGHVISVSYLGLTGERTHEAGGGWQGWYEYFPWEDHRAGAPEMLEARIVPRLRRWAAGSDRRGGRVAVSFGLDGHRWSEDFALQRYELLYEAGLIPEADGDDPLPGRHMLADHRRILATAIARLRGKIKYRPMVFELLPPAFTLLQLQRSVEAIAGHPLHKGNFRRLIEAQQLVEETGEVTAATGGRPARLVRFRRDVLAERAAAGTKPAAG